MEKEESDKIWDPKYKERFFKQIKRSRAKNQSIVQTESIQGCQTASGSRRLSKIHRNISAGLRGNQCENADTQAKKTAEREKRKARDVSSEDLKLGVFKVGQQ